MSLPKIYTDETAAREHLEKLQWPDGPICPHCGNADPERITLLKGKSTRPGVYKCRECEKPFSVTVGTVFERSHIPLHKWLYATHLLTASKKGMSAHQLHRTLKVTYKTAWFMAHRIREAMRPSNLGPMGGGGPVEVDETRFGRLEGFAHWKPKGGGSHMNMVLSLVERGGAARSFHIEGATIATLGPIIRTNINREARLMTDEGVWYREIGREFASHERVHHASGEYVRRHVHTNTVEGYFSIFKRGMRGIYQHCSEKHLHRYLSEFDFRYSYRVALGYNDEMRAAIALTGIRGKRLTYRQPNSAAIAEIPF